MYRDTSARSLNRATKNILVPIANNIRMTHLIHPPIQAVPRLVSVKRHANPYKNSVAHKGKRIVILQQDMGSNLQVRVGLGELTELLRSNTRTASTSLCRRASVLGYKALSMLPSPSKQLPSPF